MVLNPGGTALAANPAVSSQTFAQVFGTPDAITVNPLASWTDVIGDFNGDGVPDLLIYSTRLGEQRPFAASVCKLSGREVRRTPETEFAYVVPELLPD
jgi:hypothetical protein